MTIFVGSGSSPPKSANIAAKRGIRKSSMKAVAPMLTEKTTSG